MTDPRTLTIDLAVYSLDCIKRAAYRFTNRFSLEMQIEGNKALCTLIFDPSISDTMVEPVVSAFRKELLDQDLRASISEETQEIRNLILAHAFSRTGLISDVEIPTS